MMTSRRALALTLLSLCAIGAPIHADAAPAAERPAVPAPLLPWVPWVMHDHKAEVCTAMGSERLCTWPGRLALRIDAAGGSFKLDVWLDRPGRVALPGDKRLWPQNVVDDRQLPTLRQDDAGKPWVRLDAGLHAISGRFDWRRPPEVLTVPPDVGMVSLMVGGQAVTRLRRQNDRLWLQQGAGDGDQETDSLRVSVHRRLQDGVPLRVTTRLELKVAGRTRDAQLGKVLLSGGRPVAVRSQLPVQVAPDGSVRAHVRPGSHRIEIDALHVGDPKQLAPPKPGAAFDPHEVWLWLPDETLRSVELTGLAAVDPERTSLASDWRGGPTWMAKHGQQLKLQVTRRGVEEPPPNRLELRRAIWLDLDGKGLSVRDRLTGEMHRDWRLDWAGAGNLGRVRDQAQSRDLLITAHPKSQRPGVELRQGGLDLQAELRLPEAGEGLAAVGWDFDPQSLQATLYLPPGWRLLGATGVDRMPGTWLASWTLFDFFLVLMVALGTGKLLGWRWGGIALAALVLSHGESGTPRWVWLNLLAALALVRVLPITAVWWRRLAQTWRALVVLALVMILVPFAIGQIRHGLYPQTGQPGDWTDGMGMVLGGAQMDQVKEESKPMATRAAPRKKRRWAKGKKSSRSIADVLGKGGYDNARQQLQQIDPNAVVQTGAGLPDWHWSRQSLNWSGPVRRDHRIELFLLSPTWNLLLAVLRVALLLALGLALCEVGALRRWLTSFGGRIGGAASLGWLLALLAPSLLLPGRAEADEASPPPQPPPQQQRIQSTNAANLAPRPMGARKGPGMQVHAGPEPSPATLDTLRDRLLESTACKGPCVTVSHLSLAVRERQVELVAEVHAQRLAAWSLPGPLAALSIVEVKVDEQATDHLRRGEGGLLQVQLPAGRHMVVARGQLSGGRVVTLRFDPQGRPHRLNFDGPGWRIDGLDDSGVPDDSVQLARQATTAEADGRVDAGQSELPPWFTVERHLLLGMPWQVNTVVRREGSERPQLVKIPLLAGEAVMTAGVRVEEVDGVRLALVSLARGVSAFPFSSELPVVPALQLAAPEGKPWTERWTVSCSPIWRCDFDGPAPVRRETSEGQLEPHWQPWPGESVKIDIERPKGAAGQAVTVDQVIYSVKPGQRLLEATLDLRIRASQGGWRKITLPAGAELQKVQIDGEARHIRSDAKNVVHLPLRPGEQKFKVRWQQPWSRSIVEKVPAVDLGGPAVNVGVRMELGEERWLLWATGPSWGPAVLFWSHLLVLALLAVLLGRIGVLGVRTWQWLLLGLGFVQLPVVVLLLVVGWFAVIAWRERFWVERHEDKWVVPFNMGQVALVGYTAVALVCLYAAIHTNLLLDLDMQVKGGGSSNDALAWYVDRVTGRLPSAGMISLPVLVWRLAMLLWSLWLVGALLRWLPKAWRSFGSAGLWRRASVREKVAAGVGADSSGVPIPPPPAEE